MIGEMVGDWMTNRYPAVMIDGKTAYILSDQDKQKIINTAKLLSASAALLYEFDVNTASASAEEAVRWNAIYINKGKVPEADQNKANEMARHISSDRNAGWKFLRSKRQADLLYQLNTNENLEIQVDVNDLGELKITGSSWESKPDGRQVIVVRPTTYNVWAITGSLTLVRRTNGTYGVFNDTYNFEMHNSGILAVPRNIETVIGSPRCTATSGCTSYNIKFNGNFDANKIKNLRDFQ
ncbi:Uncharacterised protein [Moraxella cuniculi]|uniref:VENN motif-containing domain-containing protein n=2 Tax=Moraxella cuniculi TaxID=34061 RepID=A0A448GYX8_9GAMM|nr:Uncharacterised protein [Moraxella cuniculi]